MRSDLFDLVYDMGGGFKQRWYKSNDAVTAAATRKSKGSMVGWSAALEYSASSRSVGHLSRG